MNPYKEILLELEHGLWNHDCLVDAGVASPYQYDDEAFRACCKIFMEGLMWKLWEYQERLGTTQGVRERKAEAAGKALCELIAKFADINTRELYERKEVSNEDRKRY